VCIGVGPAGLPGRGGARVYWQYSGGGGDYTGGRASEPQEASMLLQPRRERAKVADACTRLGGHDAPPHPLLLPARTHTHSCTLWHSGCRASEAQLEAHMQGVLRGEGRWQGLLLLLLEAACGWSNKINTQLTRATRLTLSLSLSRAAAAGGGGGSSQRGARHALSPMPRSM